MKKILFILLIPCLGYGSLAEEAYERGARALVAYITSEGDQAFHDVASILQLGLLSATERENRGITGRGLTPAADRLAGSSGAVFTTLVTHTTGPLALSSPKKIFLIFSLDLLNTGTYQYLSHQFGTRHGKTYANRLPILDFVDAINLDPEAHHMNEVMIQNRIPPESIVGILVSHPEQKQRLLELTDLDESFIHVNFSEKVLDSAKPSNHTVSHAQCHPLDIQAIRKSQSIPAMHAPHL